MKHVYNGAHHTRYEYLFMQLLLISEINNNKKKIEIIEDVGLGTMKEEFGKHKGKAPTGAEIIQILIYLANIGHFPDTFASSKVIMHYLCKGKDGDEEYNNFYKIFRRGIHKEARPLFDNTIDSKNYFKIHYFVALFLIERYKGNNSKNRDLSVICSNILIGYLDKANTEKESISRLWKLYEGIRKLSYLVLDMNYTPVPISLNVSSIILNSGNFLNDILDEESPMNKTLYQLNEIINSQIYNAPKSILFSTQVATKILREFDVSEIRNIQDMKVAFMPNHKNIKSKQYLYRENNSDELNVDWIEGTEISLFHTVNETNKYDVLELELEKQKKLGSRNCCLGIQYSAGASRRYYTYAIKKGREDKQIEISQKIISDIVSTCYNLSNDANRVLVQYILKSIFSFNDNFYNISPVIEDKMNDSVFIGDGTKNIAKEIEKKYKPNNKIHKNKKHEILTTARVLREINYRGKVICFIGNIRIVPKSNGETKDEIDGLIYFPNRSLADGFCIIVETKTVLKEVQLLKNS